MQRDNYDNEKHKILDILRCLNITFSSKKKSINTQWQKILLMGKILL